MFVTATLNQIWMSFKESDCVVISVRLDLLEASLAPRPAVVAQL